MFRDNKNRYVFGYMQFLVECGLFETVEVNFLPVGHTHTDIDQLFSRISIHMYGRACLGFDMLLDMCKKACKQVKYTARLYGFANFKQHLLDKELIAKPGNKDFRGDAVPLQQLAEFRVQYAVIRQS